jgi:hypothetical protein
MHVTQEERIEEFLMHFGVKGMHWGVRRPRTAADVQKELDKIDKKRNSISRQLIPAGNIFAGAGARAGASQKVLKLKTVTALDGSKRLVPSDKTPKVTAANSDYYDRKIDRRTYLKYTAAGAASVATILATGEVGRLKAGDPSLAALARKGSLFLAAGQTIHTVNILWGVHRNISDRELNARVRELKKELKTLS